VPGVAIVGLKLVIVGAPGDAVTVNALPLVAVPDGEVTLIVPEVAPAGTVATICVGLAEEMTAVVPLNLTVSWLGKELKPVPTIVTEVPTGPLVGENVVIAIGVCRVIDRILPTAS
jgi:hypothetical protein